MISTRDLSALELICINCRGAMQSRETCFECKKCGYAYEKSSVNQYICLPKKTESILFAQASQDFNSILRNFFKRWSGVYYFIAYYFGPVLFTGMRAKHFLEAYTEPGNIIIDLGSGPHVLRTDVINVDIESYSSVHIVADAGHLPFADNSIDAVVCEEVLEHSTDPHALLLEVERVLKPEGKAYFAVPFMYPYHAAPVDYTRWTSEGFKALLHKFTCIESGVLAGSFSAFTTMLCYMLALLISFNSKKIFWLVMNISIFIFFPIKLFDAIFARFSTNENMAAVMYYVVKKNN